MKAFHNEFRVALSKNASHDDLVGIMRRHKEYGLGQECAYSVLELIWLRRGCRETETSPVCDQLEGVMDRIWGFCPAARSIWDGSLDDQRMKSYRGLPELEENMLRQFNQGNCEELRICGLTLLERRFPGQVTPEIIERVNRQTSFDALRDWLWISARLFPTIEEIAADMRRSDFTAPDAITTHQ